MLRVRGKGRDNLGIILAYCGERRNKRPFSFPLASGSGHDDFILLGSGEKGRAYNMKDENLSLFTNTLLELMDKNMNKMSVLTYIEKVIKATQQSSTTIGDEIQAPQLLKSIEFNTPESKITF